MIDFQVLPTQNTKVFLFMDISNYLEPPINTQVKVQFPNFDKKYTATFNPNSPIVLSTSRLKYNDCDIDFPDGVYCFEFLVDGISIRKVVFRTTKLSLKFDDFIRKSDLKNKNDLNKINKIYLYLRSAETVVCENENLAKEYYNLANKLLNCD